MIPHEPGIKGKFPGDFKRKKVVEERKGR